MSTIAPEPPALPEKSEPKVPEAPKEPEVKALPPKPVYVLDSTHRCDHSECSAQAYVKTTLLSGKYLLFCKHHYDSVKQAISSFVSTITDETQRLLEGNRHQGSEN
jgi:hypothetical protein